LLIGTFIINHQVQLEKPYFFPLLLVDGLAAAFSFAALGAVTFLACRINKTQTPIYKTTI
jgi:hypothetical protein